MVVCGRKLETIAQEEFWVWFLKGWRGRGGGQLLVSAGARGGGRGREGGLQSRLGRRLCFSSGGRSFWIGGGRVVFVGRWMGGIMAGEGGIGGRCLQGNSRA